MSGRRNFIKKSILGVSSALLLEACEKSVRKAIPFLNQPEDIIPGEAEYYATGYYDGIEAGNLIIKCREGKPIHVSGNPASLSSMGITHPSLLSAHHNLYGNNKIQGNSKQGTSISKEEVSILLKNLISAEKPFIVITPPVISPIKKELVSRIKTVYPKVVFIQTACIGFDNMAKAMQTDYIPSLDLENTSYLLSVNMDFLLSSPFQNNFINDYGTHRTHIYHEQWESRESLTGMNSNSTFLIDTEEEKMLLQAIADKLSGKSTISTINTLLDLDATLEKLRFHGKNALVLSGTNELEIQTIVKQINELLGNHELFRTNAGSIHKCAMNDEYFQFLESLNGDNVSGMLLLNTDAPGLLSSRFSSEFKKIKHRIACYEQENIITRECNYTIGLKNPLECWDIINASLDQLSVCQPVFNSKSNNLSEIELLNILANESSEYDDYAMLTAFLEHHVFKKPLSQPEMQNIIRHSIIPDTLNNKPTLNKSLEKSFSLLNKTKDTNACHVRFYRWGYSQMKYTNAWISEIGDPANLTTWNAPCIISKTFAKKHGLIEGDVVRLNNSMEMPVGISDKQSSTTISIPALHAPYFQENEIIKSIEKIAVTNPITRHPWQIEKQNNVFGKLEHKITTKKNTPRWLMSIDLNKCIGCGACSLGCMIENNIPPVGQHEIAKGRTMQWMRVMPVTTKEKEHLHFLPLLCQHCETAPCEAVCPVAASIHSTDGINQTVYNRCIGTRFCNNNCPYRVRMFNYHDYTGADAIIGNETLSAQFMAQFNDALNPDVTVRSKGVIEKCSFCIQRINEVKIRAKAENRSIVDGEINPACAQACPTRAITFGDSTDEKSKIFAHLNDERARVLLPSSQTRPSVIYLARTL